MPHLLMHSVILPTADPSKRNLFLTRWPPTIPPPQKWNHILQSSENSKSMLYGIITHKQVISAFCEQTFIFRIFSNRSHHKTWTYQTIRWNEILNMKNKKKSLVIFFVCFIFQKPKKQRLCLPPTHPHSPTQECTWQDHTGCPTRDGHDKPLPYQKYGSEEETIQDNPIGESCVTSLDSIFSLGFSRQMLKTHKEHFKE